MHRALYSIGGWVIFFLLPGLVVSYPLYAQTQSEPKLAELKGRDWLRMSAEEKSSYVEDAMALFDSAGIHLEVAPVTYIDTMDTWLIEKPRYMREDLGTLFSTLSYALEPQIRDLSVPPPLPRTASGVEGVRTTIRPRGRVAPSWGWTYDDERDDADDVPGNW